MKFLAAILVSIFLGLVAGKEVGVRHFNGYQVLTVGVANTTEQYQLLNSLYMNDEYDFWTSPKLHGFTDIMVAGEQIPQLTAMLKQAGLGWTVKIADVGKLIEKERDENERHRLAADGMSWVAYQRWSVIETWIQSLPVDYSGLAEVTQLDTTFEGRKVLMVKVSTGPLPGEGSKKVIFIDANIHAREWIAGATGTWMLNELLTNSAAYKDILDVIDFYFVPLLNVDGYEYCHTVNRMWRKTRSIHPASQCRGCDPNRNFEFKWQGESTSGDPCSDLFYGVDAFSEKETAAIRDALAEIQETARIWAYITIHSYGQLWLLPWGYTQGVYPEDYPELLAWGQASVADIKAVHGKVYVTGQGADQLYGVGGASDDYAKSKGVKYTTTAELRDEGAYGFLLPSSQIIPTAQEAWAGVLRTARTVMADNSEPLKP